MLALLLGCLVNTALYNERLAALADLDGDGAASEIDCDDLDGTVFPGAGEACNGIDDDCDGNVDEGFAGVGETCNELDDDCDGEVDEDASEATNWYADTDSDGFGNATTATLACAAPQGHVADATDCDDQTAGRYPGNAEVPYDGIDQDCDGADADDLDADGFAATAAGGDDCDDTDPLTYPGAEESWERGFTDSDCDGELEEQTEEFGTDAWVGRVASGEAGASLAALGDVDGDGRDEFAVAAYYDGAAFDYGGAVFVVHGAETGPLAEQTTLEASGDFWFLGTGLDGGSDVDGDGLPDVLVGATGYDNGRGIALVLPGAALASPGGMSALSTAIGGVVGAEPAAYLGARVTFGHDLDGDGLDEVVASAPYATAAGSPQAGSVYVFTGAELVEMGTVVGASMADTTWSGNAAGQGVGNNVHAIGDQDGDGRSDIAVSNGTTELWVIPGGAASGTVDGLALTRVTDAVADTRMVGDIDADGRVDLAVLGTAAAIYTDLSAYPAWERSDAYLTVDALGDAVTDMIDLGDRDADDRPETLLLIASNTRLGSGWAGVMDSDGVRFGATVDTATLRLQAVATRRASDLGCRAAPVGDVAGDGGAWFAVGGRLDDEGGDDAGAVVLLPVPE